MLNTATDPSLGKLLVLRNFIPNYLPERYRENIFGNSKNRSIVSGLVRLHGEWFIRIDCLRSLPDDQIDVVVDSMRMEYLKIFPDIDPSSYIFRSGKSVIRKTVPPTTRLMNKLYEVPGVVILPFIIMSSESNSFVIKFPESSGNMVTRLVMDYVSDAPFPSNIVSLVDDRPSGLHSILSISERLGADISDYVLIRTVYEMSTAEMDGQNCGIFRNKMSLFPKLFDPENSTIVSRLEGNFVEPTRCHEKPAEISSSAGFQLMEISLKSKWFKDIFDDVIYTSGGASMYWAYSDGSGRLENYFIVYKKNVTDFLVGLRKYWSRPTRNDHKNWIDLVVDLPVFGYLNK